MGRMNWEVIEGHSIPIWGSRTGDLFWRITDSERGWFMLYCYDQADMFRGKSRAKIQLRFETLEAAKAHAESMAKEVAA